MPMHTSDTRLSHIDCLRRLGWLSFDVTHMGEPDGYLLSPCCEHGYRAVWGPRPKLEWARPLTREGLNQGRHATAGAYMRPYDRLQAPGQTGSGSLENVWQWGDPYGADQASFFTVEQVEGRYGIGSWVLIAGARQDGDGPPIDAQAKWWVTTQTDADSLEQEITSLSDVYNTQGASSPSDFLGKNQNNLYPGLVRWTKDQDAVAGETSSSSLGIEDPGLGEASGLPDLDAGFASDTIWWVKYGNRPFLGINRCNDPIGANQERDDHSHHGAGSNWRGTGLSDEDVNNIISPQASARGGYTPNIIFYGGDIRGVTGTATCDSDGDITGVTLLDPGATVITDAQQDSIEAPLVSVSMPNHYAGFEAKAKISTDPNEIKSVLPGLFKSKYEMLVECSGGYNDPIAQTFLVSARQYPDGIFVPSIDICFSSRPRYGVFDPVYLELRPTVNGFPSADKIITSKMHYPPRVNVSPGLEYDELPVPAWENPALHDLGNARDFRADYPAFDTELGYTRFTFRYPVHLEAGQEYAIVVRSNNTDYKCWIADTRGNEVNKGQSLSNYDSDGYSKVTAVHKKQYGGSFFRSQNGRTWTPDQWQDLMFRVNKCNFSGTGSGSYRAGSWAKSDFLYDRMNLNFHSFLTPGSDTSISATLSTQKETDSEGTLTEVSGLSGKLAGSTFTEGVTKSLPERMKIYKDKHHNTGSIKLNLTLNTENPDVTPIIDTRNMSVLLHKNIIDDGGLTASDIIINTPGQNYDDLDEFSVSGGGSTENATFKISNGGTDADGRILKIEIMTAGKGFHKSTDPLDPIVITQTSTATGTGGTFSVLSEEGQSGGNGKARYVTKTVNLAPGMSARAIKVFLTARQPYESNIHVYYKALSEEDDEPITQKRWKLMERIKPDEDAFFDLSSSFYTSGGFHEYEFDTEELIEYTRIDGKTFDSFKSFAIKIVLSAQNPAKPPEVKDFRAIAVF